MSALEVSSNDTKRLLVPAASFRTTPGSDEHVITEKRRGDGIHLRPEP